MDDNHFGDWSIDQKVYGWIFSNLHCGSTILELGSGWASGELARHYNVISIENCEKYYDLYPVRYIKAINPNSWYDANIIRHELKDTSYDLLLIDGPQNYKRHEIMNNLDLFNWNVKVVIDDVQESKIMEIGKIISENVCKRPYDLIHGNNKIAMVIP